LPAATYTQNERSWGAVTTFAIGLLLTSILVLYLSRSRAELERTREISELKLRFFSMASHEFRTPLSTILISSQSLEANIYESSEEQKIKTIQRIQAAAKRMIQLLNDSLTITRAEAGKLEFAPELMNLEQFCRQLIEEVQFDSNARHQITLISHNADTKAYLDKKLLRSLLTNLLSNAIKYSPPDSEIDFILHCDAKEVGFKICDRGIGIPPEDRERLFETFHRGSNVGDITGTGLGLAVVKTCVDLHGGQIAVESEMGVGTRFTVILPHEETRARE
ncbi:MAG: HAMP domain-containing histidine kinase, partial [Coleofasciculus sp. S288]|nr:HAMP domain-containing histidine kinase [Coleofasciculus sp. S288]